MARIHRMTPARRAALRKAQLASARKRRGHGRGKLSAANRRYDTAKRRIKIGAAVVGTAVVVGAAAYAAPKAHKHIRHMKIEKLKREARTRLRVKAEVNRINRNAAQASANIKSPGFAARRSKRKVTAHRVTSFSTQLALPAGHSSTRKAIHGTRIK